MAKECDMFFKGFTRGGRKYESLSFVGNDLVFFQSKRLAANVIWFIHNCRNRKSRLLEILNSLELVARERHLVGTAQNESFANEITYLKNSLLLKLSEIQIILLTLRIFKEYMVDYIM